MILLAVAYAIATIDIRTHDGRVLRNVELSRVDVGGMTTAELDAAIDHINSLVEDAPVFIETPEALYQINADRLGLHLDRDATRNAVLNAGRDRTQATAPFRWFGSFFSPVHVKASLTLDPVAAEAGLAAVSKTISVEPGKPTMSVVNGRLELRPGEPGKILDVPLLLADLSDALPDEPGAPINVAAYTTTDAVVDVEIQALVDRLNGFTTEPIEFVLADQTYPMPPIAFRSMVELVLDGPEPRARIDAMWFYEWINAAAGIGIGEVDTTSLVVDGSQIRLPQSNSSRCCTAETADLVLGRVLANNKRIELEPIVDDLTPLVELGIGELVGEFTTNHPAGQDRVVNIQRMADIVRGAMIEPGGSFSLNGYVGERTTSKGFVPAGVIYNGEFTDDVGGGVSQFATTLFNAAFFGGLDIDRYQAHSIYIDRYPYGREATVNWPGIDLVITNPTDYPIVIWTEYTANSITVKLFGTAVVTGDQTDQTTEAVDECTRVRTERTRTWFDGSTDVDRFVAVYQPEEGLGCDGLPTVPPPECGPDELLVDTTNNGFGDTCAPLAEICPPPGFPVDDNNDGLMDTCELRDCPTEAIPTDTDGDGQSDACVFPTPTPEPNPEPTPTPDAGSADPTPEPTGDGSGS